MTGSPGRGRVGRAPGRRSGAAEVTRSCLDRVHGAGPDSYACCVIETSGLTRRFGPLTAVAGLDLRVAPGELYGFLGPNGAGKTTTLRMLAGLLRPHAGRIRLAGIDPAEEPRRARSRTGFVPDTPPLYEHLTGRQHLGLVASLYGVPPAARDARAVDLLEAFGLAERADELIKGYSHGMRKKLHLAAVLLTRPRVLLLDEPTTGLDPRSARVLKDLLQEFCDRGGTVLLSTHLLDTAERICHRVGILDHGRLLAEGEVGALLAGGAHGTLEDVFLRLTGEGSETSHAGPGPG
ncbi:MAG: ABC transporter ATP-binding protein [Planctomycetota bacterium]|nr:MAG: ABC transporter ATP-binding protein [Planctomycetota bacterium]